MTDNFDSIKNENVRASAESKEGYTSVPNYIIDALAYLKEPLILARYLILIRYKFTYANVAKISLRDLEEIFNTTRPQTIKTLNYLMKCNLIVFTKSEARKNYYRLGTIEEFKDIMESIGLKRNLKDNEGLKINLSNDEGLKINLCGFKNKPMKVQKETYIGLKINPPKVQKETYRPLENEDPESVCGTPKNSYIKTLEKSLVINVIKKENESGFNNNNNQNLTPEEEQETPTASISSPIEIPKKFVEVKKIGNTSARRCLDLFLELNKDEIKVRAILEDEDIYSSYYSSFNKVLDNLLSEEELSSLIKDMNKFGYNVSKILSNPKYISDPNSLQRIQGFISFQKDQKGKEEAKESNWCSYNVPDQEVASMNYKLQLVKEKPEIPCVFFSFVDYYRSISDFGTHEQALQTVYEKVEERIKENREVKELYQKFLKYLEASVSYIFKQKLQEDKRYLNSIKASVDYIEATFSGIDGINTGYDLVGVKSKLADFGI